MRTLKLIISLLSAIASAYFVVIGNVAVGCYLMLVALFFILLPEA